MLKMPTFLLKTLEGVVCSISSLLSLTKQYTWQQVLLQKWSFLWDPDLLIIFETLWLARRRCFIPIFPFSAQGCFTFQVHFTSKKHKINNKHTCKKKTYIQIPDYLSYISSMFLDMSSSKWPSPYSNQDLGMDKRQSSNYQRDRVGR